MIIIKYNRLIYNYTCNPCNLNLPNKAFLTFKYDISLRYCESYNVLIGCSFHNFIKLSCCKFWNPRLAVNTKFTTWQLFLYLLPPDKFKIYTKTLLQIMPFDKYSFIPKYNDASDEKNIKLFHQKEYVGTFNFYLKTVMLFFFKASK